jgi:hypothetical protein
MASTYSPSLRLELIGPGEQAGVWNTTTNTNLGTLLETAIAGNVTVSVTSANQALTATNGVSDQSRQAILTLTTTTAAAFAIYAPPQAKQYIVFNTTAYDATIYNSTVLGNTTAAGLGVIVPAGKKLIVFSDTTNFRTVESSLFTTTTGTGAVVLATSPTITTPTISSATLTAPILGTPVSGTLDNCTSNTEVFGDSTTQLATTAFVQAALQALHPVGSIYTSTAATNPGTTFGFGTWVQFGAGRVLMGNGGSFGAGTTGGSNDAVVVSHTHTASVSDPSHSHAPASGSTFITTAFSGDGAIDSSRVTGPDERNPFTGNTAAAVTGISVTNASAGVSGTNANLQPYVVVYIWNRTS